MSTTIQYNDERSKDISRSRRYENRTSHRSVVSPHVSLEIVDEQGQGEDGLGGVGAGMAGLEPVLVKRKLAWLEPVLVK